MKLLKEFSKTYEKAKIEIEDRLAKEEVINSYSLLIDSKKKLNYVVACILQSSVKDTNEFTNKVGRALASKIVGASSAGGLVGLVATFGTAGTGTAIGTLSGAAATNATMAWIGGVVGGGIAAGTVLTGGLALLVGIGSYKLMSPKARDYSSLSKIEREIVDKCILLIRYTEELIDITYFPTQSEMENILNESLLPLHSLIYASQVEISKKLDITNRLLFNQKAMPQFNSLIKKYEKFVKIGDF